LLKTTVWAAIYEGGIFGPFFFDDTVNSEHYLHILQNQFWPKVQEEGLEDKLIFVQDGAPSHWSRNVRDWLNKKFPE
jgi:predicted TIM-barrel fold metal-dependent hydrolase